MNNENEKENKKKKLIPLNDHSFKRMFGEVGCEGQLITLINGLININGERNIKKIEIKEKNIPRELYEDKEINLDILTETNEYETINIESQLKNVDISPRGLYYLSMILVKSVKKGENYTAMTRATAIILYGDRNKEIDEYDGYYKREKLNPYLEAHHFYMTKFDDLKNKDLNNPQHRCLMFLSHNTPEKLRKEVIKMEPNLAKAQEILDYLNSSPEEIELCEMRELVKMDIKNAKERNIREGIEIGEEKGIKKGRKEGKIEIASLLIKENLPIKTISKTTGLSIEKIQKLKQEQEQK